MNILIRFLSVVFALLLANYLIEGIQVSSFYIACIVAILLGLINLFVRPILMLLTLPLTILTFGLFLFILNAGIFLFLGSFIEGFSVSGFIPALLGSMIVSATSWLVSKFT
jgi:putative membrane protein